MKKKIPFIFLISCKINIFSTIIFWGAFGFYQNYQVTKDKDYLWLRLFVLASVVAFYAIIYLLGMKLVKHYFNPVHTSKPKKNARLILYIFEIIFFILYTYLAYLMISTFAVTNFLPFNIYNAFRTIAFIAFFAAYISSLLRIIFTWPFFNMVNNQRFEFVDTIGEASSEPLQTISY